MFKHFDSILLIRVLLCSLVACNNDPLHPDIGTKNLSSLSMIGYHAVDKISGTPKEDLLAKIA